MNNSKKKRITMKLKSPNPLFEKWLIEWRDKARGENSKMEFCFTMALQSLKRYPLPLESGRDCNILKGFGEKLCLMIDNKLKAHQNMTNTLDDKAKENVRIVKEADNSVGTKRKLVHTDSPSKSKTKRSKEYMPQDGSGGYAILITLFTESLDPMYPGFSTKAEIIKKGQHLSNTSFTKPDPGSKYTAWSSMRILIAKNLVIKKSNPAKFSLSDEGLVLARKLFDKERNSGSCKISLDEPTQSNNQTINKAQSKVISIDLSKSTKVPSTYDPSIVSNKTSCSSRIFMQSSATSSENENALHSDLSDKIKTKLIQKHVSSSSVASSTQSLSQEECFILPADTFDVILYVDTCETSG